jgi:class 3 adenylate cyclase
MMMRRIARHLYRPTATLAPAARRRAFYANLALAGCVVLLLTAALAWNVTGMVRSFDAMTAWEVLPRSAWRALYASEAVSLESACDAGKVAEAPCPAAVDALDRGALWTSAFRRDDQDHVARASEVAGKAFWIGAVVSVEQLASARLLGANHLVLGYLNGTWELWIDGVQHAVGTTATQAPIVVALPQARLAEARPLAVAFRVRAEAGGRYPVLLNLDRAEGLTTSDGADAYRRVEWFETQVRPWMFVAIYATFGWLVLFVWLQNRVRQEYFYMGVYALFHSLVQCVRSDATYAGMSSVTWDALQVPLVAWEGGAALFLGLALARTRRAAFTFGIPVVAIFPIALTPWVRDGVAATELAAALTAWFVPVCYGLGAAACGLQAWYVASGSEASRTIRRRAVRLAGFASGLALLGVTYRVQAASVSDTFAYVEWHRFLNLAVVIAFFWLAIRDFREIDLLAQNSPVSPFHRKAILPDRVAGVLAILDLKNSEGLFAQGAQQGRAEQIVLACLSHMWTVMTRAGGVVLQSDGDSLIAFFEAHPGAEPGAELMRAASALAATASELESLSHQLVERQVLPVELTPVRFRAALAEGEIRPIWQEVDGARYPSWTSAGPKNVFLEAARLAELERQIPAARERSSVVLRRELASRLPGNERQRLAWIARAAVLRDKHGNEHEVALLDVSPAGTTAPLPQAKLEMTA